MAPTPKKATPSKSPAAAPKLSTASKKTENKSILSDFGGLYFNLFVLALAVAVYAVDNYAGLKALLPPPAATKPFSTFKDFFPFYLKEHSNPINRGLHCIGTSLATTIALAYPPTILAMLVAGSIGMIIAPYLLFLPHGAVEAVVVFGLFGILAAKWNKSLVPALAVPLAGYSFAWVGHFYYEMNKPASFIYPTYSLFGDFNMIYEVIQGRISIF